MSLFARLFRAALLTGAATATLSSAALAASFTVNPAPPTDTTAKTVAGGDTGTIAVGGILSTTTGVTWSLNTNITATALINNSGTITGTTRGIDTSSNGGGAARSFTLDNLTAGSIVSGVNDGFRINNDIGAGTVTVVNYGTIQSTGVNGNGGQALDFNAITTTTGHVSITNEASGIIQAADADAIRPGNSSIINNYGQIIAGANPSTDTGNDAIDFQDPGKSGTINNYQTGSIIGARDGITAKENLVINNSGILTGQGGSGINLDTTSGSTTIVNSTGGVITGTALNGADGDGIDVDWGVNITNSGKIQAVGLSTGGALNEALAIGGGTVNNLAGGIIISDQRAITVDDSNLGNAPVLTAIDNAGTITGKNGQAIQITSTFADTLINRATGIINGSVTMGAGDNVVTLYAGSKLNGALDGGAGNDTIHLTGTGQGALANVSNVEKLNVDSATWAISGGQSYSGGVTVAAGATAQVSGLLGGNVTNNGTVTVTGGSAQFNGTFQNNGAYKSDPSTQSFVNLSVGSTGYIQASSGDRYQISGNFNNVSTQKALWDTTGAILEFTGTGDHTLDVVGLNEGAGTARPANDFAWGALDIDSGNNLYLADSLGLGDGAALYVDDLVGAQIAGDLITNMFGVTGLTVFYNRDDPTNAYLNGLSYNLSNGGRLVAAVPEPLTLALFGSGLAGAVLLRRRKALKTVRADGR